METPYKVFWQTVKTQMKCPIIGQFIRVYTVCQNKVNLQRKKHEPWHEIYNNVVCATIKASDQPAQHAV